MLEEGLHGAKGSIGEASSESLGHIVRHVTMLLVEEGVENSVAGLGLSLRDSTEESKALCEFDRVSQHVKLREGLRVSFGLPVLLDVIDCGAPGIDIAGSPLA